MKFLLTVTSTNPDGDNPGFATVDMNPERAARLLELHRRGLEFVDVLDGNGLASRFFALSVGSDLGAFEALAFDEALEGVFGARGDSEDVKPYPAGLVDFQEQRVPVECFRVEIGVGALRFAALLKHGDARLSCANIYDEVVALARQATAPAPPATRQ